MNYLSVPEIAGKWQVSERTVRNYCSLGRVEGAILNGKTWMIPEQAEKPARKARQVTVPDTVLTRLQTEKQHHMKGGLYHKVQIDLTYNSNHIEGSRLTHEQTRYIFETNTIGMDQGPVRIDDIIETANHFKCIDTVIDQASSGLTEALIKQLHRTLKSGTEDSRTDWLAVGDYKRLENEVGGMETVLPENVAGEMKALLSRYRAGKGKKTLDDLLEFHYRFERIHPFQDGNGRVGRLILFKECLKYNIVPFIISDDLKMYYYRGLKEWQNEKGFLRDTCLTAQDRFRKTLDYFRISYDE